MQSKKGPVFATAVIAGTMAQSFPHTHTHTRAYARYTHARTHTHTGAVLPKPVEDTIPKIPLGTPPHPGWVHSDNLQSCTSLNPDEIITASDLDAMAFGRNKPKPDCFNYYTLDNHADICIFCNAGLLANIRPSEFRVNGIGNSNIQFDKEGSRRPSLLRNLYICARQSLQSI